MTTSFQIIALPSERFAPLFHQSDEELQASSLHIHNARPGCYNCRVVRA